MEKRIVVPLDTSDLAERVLPYVQVIASGLKAEVDLVTVAEPGAEKLEHPLRSYLAEVAGRLKLDEGSAKQEVLFGRAADQIVDYAVDNEAVLIAMASRGLSGVTRWVMGSVADKILRGAECPVFLVKAPEPKKVKPWQGKRIMICLDGSQVAECVFRVMDEVSWAPELDIDLVRVVEPPTAPPDVDENSSQWKGYKDYIMSRSELAARAYVEEIEKPLKKQGRWKTRTQVLFGVPARQIIDYASQNNIDVILMSTIGRSGLGPWTHGGVASKVVEGATTPILLVNARRYMPKLEEEEDKGAGGTIPFWRVS
ncbi:MAG: universal stress protein [Dehalococcoidia bacterium]|nr:universal stress protein [Dehalococcoidia bacterium]